MNCTFQTLADFRWFFKMVVDPYQHLEVFLQTLLTLDFVKESQISMLIRDNGVQLKMAWNDPVSAGEWLIRCRCCSSMQLVGISQLSI